VRLSDPLTDRSLAVIALGSVPGFVALVSTFSILSKRPSKSSVRFAAQQQRARDAEGRFGAPSEKGNTARFGQRECEIGGGKDRSPLHDSSRSRKPLVIQQYAFLLPPGGGGSSGPWISTFPRIRAAYYWSFRQVLQVYIEGRTQSPVKAHPKSRATPRKGAPKVPWIVPISHRSYSQPTGSECPFTGELVSVIYRLPRRGLFLSQASAANVRSQSVTGCPSAGAVQHNKLVMVRQN